VGWGSIVAAAVKAKDAGKPPATTQSNVATVSFLVWRFALHSGPFAPMMYDARLRIGLIVP
jgi:hypothetical protein